jgi:membrane protein implicated in regulation of membrane protease activity
MDMDQFTIFHFYLGLFLLGVGYAAIAVLMGQILGGHDHPGDVGAHDVGGSEADGSGPAGHHFETETNMSEDNAPGSSDHPADLAVDGGDTMPNLSPWSPVTIASFVTTLGGVGMVLDEAGLPGLLSFPVAAICGAVIAAAVFYLFYRIFSVTQGSSGVSARQAIGRPAEVITPIPPNGAGEIAYVLGGRRFNAPARTEDGHPIPAHAAVVIVRRQGGAFYVRESVAERIKGSLQQVGEGRAD